MTGNHNLLVDPNNPLAIDRGGAFVVINATELILDSTITIEIAPDYFEFKDFWRFFAILMVFLWVILAFKISNGYIAKSKGIDLAEQAL